jgi:hypothetical protein
MIFIVVVVVVVVVVAFFLPLDVDVLSRKGNLLELGCSSVLLCTWVPNALLTFAREKFFGPVFTRAGIL